MKSFKQFFSESVNGEVELDESMYIVKARNPAYTTDRYINTDDPRTHLIKNHIKHASHMPLEKAQKVAKEVSDGNWKAEVVPAPKAGEDALSGKYKTKEGGTAEVSKHPTVKGKWKIKWPDGLNSDLAHNTRSVQTYINKGHLVKEEVELDEVSASTLMNYSIKAAQQGGDKRVAGQKMADEKVRKKYGYSSSAKVAAGSRKQNEQLDEIGDTQRGRDTLNRYVTRASGDHTMANFAKRMTANDSSERGKKDHEYYSRKTKNLKKGISRAIDRLDKYE